MEKEKLVNKLIALIVFLPLLCFAQKHDKNLEIGKYYLLHGNLEDASYYLDKADFKHSTLTSRYYLSKCLFDMQKYTQAEKYVERLENSDSAKYLQASIYKANEQWSKAFEVFSTLSYRDSKKQSESCRYLKDVKSFNVKVKNLSRVNTSHSEMSPYAFDSSLMFSSNREQLVIKKKDKVSGDAQYDFYTLNKEKGSVSKYDSKLNTFNNELYPSLNSSGDTLYFCRARQKKGDKHTKIYRSIKEEEKWNSPDSFFMNDSTYSFSHPSVSPDGKLFFFCSDMKGGYGGFDIYVSMKTDTNWTAPMNLGEAVNSSANEISPTFDGEKLVFTSNRAYSFGGYDVFYSSFLNGDFSNALNAGNKINSQANELDVFIWEQDKKWLITSDRIGGKGKEDIYEVIFY